MGGSYSSRWGDYQKKKTVEEVIGLSLLRLQELGVVRRWFPCRGQLTYQIPRPFGWLNPCPNIDGTLNYTISWYPEMMMEIEELGSVEFCTSWVFIRNSKRLAERIWFHCPRCSRRVSWLYFFPHQTILACRKCHDLTYKSVQNRRRRIETLTRIFQGMERMTEISRNLEERYKIALQIKDLLPQLKKKYPASRI